MRIPAPKPPTPRQLNLFRARLLAARRRVVGQLGRVDEGLRDIEGARDGELEERSQVLSAADVFLRLSDEEFASFSRIEGALHRLATGSYGFCTRCSTALAVERLQADPSAPLCSACAKKNERPPRPGIESEPAPAAARKTLPPDLLALDDAEIAELVRECFREEVGEALEDVRVACRRAVVTLAGEVASTDLRQIALQIVEDEMGLESVDRIRISSVAADDDSTFEPRDNLDELGIDLSGADGISEDIFAVEEDGLVYNPPARPVAE